MPTKPQNKEKLNIMDAFRDYAKQELEFIASSEPGKLYHRVIPNIKEKNKGYIDFLYNKIVIGGYIDGNTIYLNKLRVAKGGQESDIDKAMAKVKETIEKGDMGLVDNIN